MVLKLDPKQVFGNQTTCFAQNSLALLGATMADIENCSSWIDYVVVENGYTHDVMPRKIPAKGKMILIFWENGRIDRFEVLSSGKLRCWLSNNGKKRYEDIDYVAKRVGDGSVWIYDKGIWHLTSSKVARIVLVD